MIRKTLALVAVMVMPAVASAGILDASFESAPADYDGWEMSGSRVAGDAGTIGVTDGVQSLALTLTGDGFSWDIRSFFDATAMSAAVAGGGTFEFDVTYDTSSIPQSAVSFLNLSIYADGGLSPWAQKNSLATTNGTTNETIHVSLSLVDDLKFETGDSWYKIGIGFNGDWVDDNDPRNTEVVTVYIDNVVVTPEPASLALLGLGGLAIAGRRRA